MSIIKQQFTHCQTNKFPKLYNHHLSPIYHCHHVNVSLFSRSPAHGAEDVAYPEPNEGLDLGDLQKAWDVPFKHDDFWVVQHVSIAPDILCFSVISIIMINITVTVLCVGFQQENSAEFCLFVRWKTISRLIRFVQDYPGLMGMNC